MKVKLGKLVNVKTGKLDANASSINGAYPFFTCSKEPLKISTYSYDCECVLVAGNGDLNVKYYNGKFDAYQRTYIIEDNGCKKIYIPYLYYFMDKYVEKLRTQSIGGVIKYIKLSNITEVEIVLPNVDIQKKIVDKLDKVNAVINKKNMQLEKLDLLVRSLFIEMFGNLGEDIFGDGLKLLKDVCQINPKKDNYIANIKDFLVSFVPMSAVSESGEIDTTIIKCYDEVKKGFTSFIEDDVLFDKITPCMENGKGAIAKKLKNSVGFGSTEFHVLRPLKDKSNSAWIYYLTSFSHFRKEAEIKMTGSAGQRRVPASFLENYKIALPPLELQHKFEKSAIVIDKSKYSSFLHLSA